MDMFRGSTMIIVTVLVAVLGTIHVRAMNYSVIESTGKFCPGRDSCRQTRNSRGPQGVENDWKKRNCFCDNSCSTYGDCCIDAPAFVKEEQVNNFGRFKCVNLKQYGDVYIRRECADDWNKENIRKACEDSDKLSDPLAATPVTNSDTGITYHNYYCAICNYDSAGPLSFWKPRLECPTLTGYSQRFRNITSNYIASKLEFDSAKGQWGVSIDVGGVPVFHECYIDPAVPDGLLGVVRTCSGKNTIADCPDGYPDDDVRDLCRSYTALVFEPNAAYRNVHCAMCHQADLKKLICLNLGPYGRFNWQQNFNSFSFAVLFDLSGNHEDSVGYAKNCKSGQLYDPFFKKCRNVVCSNEFEVIRDGRCVDPRTTTTTTTSTTTTTTSTTDTTTSTSFTTTASSLPSSTLLINITGEIPDYTEEIIVTSVDDFIEEYVDSTIASIPITVLVPEILDNSSHAKTSDTTELTSSSPLPLSSSQEAKSSKPSFTTTSAPKPLHSAEFIACSKFELTPDEFEFRENQTVVYVQKYHKFYEKEDFLINPKTGTVLICATHGEEQSFKFDPILGYVTLICLGISSLSCCLHIIGTLLSPDLQNLSGKNLLSLTVSLLGGYITFIAAMFTNNAGSSGCFILASFMYFFFLSSFAWMLVISFDVTKTLKLATTQLRLTAGSQWKKFAIYSLFGWSLPLVLVATAVSLDLSIDPESAFKPGFGLTDLCWFSRKKSLLLLFAVPFGLVMCINVFLFVSSAIIIHKTTKENSKVTLSTQTRTNFYLYLRLAVIMGVTWVVGLVAGFLDFEPLWYIFVIFNALQGLFIFVAFSCSKKVLKSIRDRLSSRSGEDFTWKWSTATKRSNLTVDTVSTTGSRSLRGTMTPGKKRVDDKTMSSSSGSTMYPVSNYQANCSLNQKSFTGRYY